MSSLVERVFDCLDSEWVHGPTGIAIDLRVSPNAVRRALKQLVADGRARYSPAYSDGGGLLAGSGYVRIE